MAKDPKKTVKPKKAAKAEKAVLIATPVVTAPVSAATPLPPAQPQPQPQPASVVVKTSRMPGRLIMILALVGIVIAIVVAYLMNLPVRPQPPAFQPAANPYDHAIFANGIIESDQTSGANINIFPEVSGRVIAQFVAEGEIVKAGQKLFGIDDTAQSALTEQQRLLAVGALALLQELKEQPRPEVLAVAVSQLSQANANFTELARQSDKLRSSAALDPRSVSRNALDSASDAAQTAKMAAEVAKRQLDLTKAGAWTYDIQNQQAQSSAQSQSYEQAKSLLAKYTIIAPADGVMMVLNAPKGSYVSTLGGYDTYTQMNLPVAVLSPGAGSLGVRVFVDEILLSRLPQNGTIKAEMSIRGANIKIPLQFVRIQPYVTPKIELSSERQEQVDLRVLPVIFKFQTDPKIKLYPGLEVDVYISE